MSTVTSMTYARMLLAPRSEVFILDLRHGDVVVVTAPEGEVTLHQVMVNDPSPLHPQARALTWARLVDISTDPSEYAATLRGHGYSAALEFSRVFHPAEDAVVEIVGRDVRR